MRALVAGILALGFAVSMATAQTHNGFDGGENKTLMAKPKAVPTVTRGHALKTEALTKLEPA